MRHIPTILSMLLAAVLFVSPQVSSAKNNRDKAIELFHQSEVAYQDGQFEKAAKLLREAYSLDPAPTLLYNLARAEESAGNLKEAVASYELYLKKDPGAKDAPAIKRRIQNLKKQIQERENLQRQHDVEKRAREELEKKKGLESSPVPWIVAGVGGAGLVVGAVVGLMAKSKHDEAVAEPVQKTASDLESSANSLGTVANISFIAGGVIAAGGLIWGIVALPGDDNERSGDVTVVPAFGPGGIGIAGTF